jgi:hypothetical protein
MSSTPATIAKFVQFCQQHLKGDEKDEAQVFTATDDLLEKLLTLNLELAAQEQRGEPVVGPWAPLE